jgi:phage terminase large subunit
MTAPLEPWAIAWAQAAETGDALLFATGVLGFLMPGVDNPNRQHQLEGWQVDALKRFSKAFQRRFVAEGRLSIKSGHGVGKTCFLCILILFVLLCAGPDTKIPVVANSQDQLRDGLWPELAKWRSKLPDALQAEIVWEKEKVFIKCAPEEAFAVRRTATKHRPEALQGIHAETILAIFEEASGIPEETIEAGAGTLSTPGAMAVAAGNPTRRTGFFHATHTKLRERWDCMTVNSEDVPRARGHIKDIIDLYGRESNKYRVRVLGEFPDKDDDTVIPLSLVEPAKTRNVAKANVWPVWGIDPGRFGDDPSTLVAREGNYLLTDMLREWQGLDGPQVAGRVIALYNETPINDRPKEICVDVIGIGASVYDHMRLPGSPVREITRGVNVAEAAAISETEYRLRDELWFRGLAWFAAKDCYFVPASRFPENEKLLEKLIGELTTPTYDYTMLGKRKVESKDELKKRGVPSPNLADAFLNTLAAGIYPRENPHHRYRPESDGSSWMSA